MELNIFSLCCKKSYDLIKYIYLKIKQTKNQEYIQISSNPNNNNEENQPANILSSEEINEIIKNQKKYNKEQSNINEYKIIKQKNSDDLPKTEEMLNLEEIKNEINQIEFEEEEQKKKNKKDDTNKDNKKYNENGINDDEVLDDEEEEDNNLNIEELRKDILESNDDD
jgi:hypothetical protein